MFFVRKELNENNDLSVVKGITRKASLTIKKERVFIVHLIIKTILLRKKQLIEWIDLKRKEEKQGLHKNGEFSFHFNSLVIQLRWGKEFENSEFEGDCKKGLDWRNG